MKYVNYKNAKYALIDLHSIISYALTHLQFIMHSSLSDISLFLALPVMAKTYYSTTLRKKLFNH